MSDSASAAGLRDELRLALVAAVTKIIAALARVLLRYGIDYGEFAAIAKRTFARVAHDEFSLTARKASVSRVSLLTGIARKEVSRLLNEELDRGWENMTKTNRGASVISGWRRDPMFLDARGNPASLPFEGAARSFSELVRLYGKDVPPRAMFDELLRIGAVDELKSGNVRLLAEAYVPASADASIIGILGADVADLVNTIGHNLDAPKSERFFQRKVSYESVSPSARMEVEGIVARDGQALLEKVDRKLARHVSRSNSSSAPEPADTRRLMVGLYVYEEKMPDEP